MARTRTPVPRVPGDASTRRGRRRAGLALAQVLSALGPGVHQLCYSAQEADGLYVVAEATVTLTDRLDAVSDELWRVEIALALGLVGARVEFAVLIVQTLGGPRPLACGWQVSGGRLHGMPAVRVQEAVTPCPGVDAPVPVAYTAPVLTAPFRASRWP
ncbi:hypothetical protein SLUN_38385 (plasmid) [Streptomyces lunaelactis]|uniref:Uncharacterized protein n=1 Tax=Streptomyces lunaelactis TaxID=1535768 RepID=A0A2R4TFJ6_9ACTN|nr:hypothetical protein [Streptomyces lunaelactis]AVZ77905.1 hypothetical protein SLUN_38385 [Streptomyces lunaelactis]NUK83434.1 hypothetical protein [Streptomyces lunaelactis]NUL01719.1 hypothetical protein [Streptomyces lunaelactis]